MSYILDALRKSENQRRIGQTPDLASAPAAAARPTRRWPAAAVAGLLVVAVAAAGWWWLSDGQETDATPPVAEIETPVAEPPAREQAPSPDRRRTVTDRRSPAQEPPVRSVSRPAPARPGAVPTPAPVVPEGERERLVETVAEAERLIAEQMAHQAGEQAAEQAREDSRAGQEPAAADLEPEEKELAGAWEPERSDFLEAWELPLDVRRELPELKLSIHVFSLEPDQRFVLINGERRLEGDGLGSGVQLVEVSRQGAVIEFRDYRFLLRP